MPVADQHSFKGKAILGRIKSTLLFEFGHLAGSTFFVQGMRLLTAIYCANLLGPTTWGYWYVLNLVIVYSPIFHLGVVNAVNRDIPVFLGSGHGAVAERTTSVSLGWLLLGTSAVGVTVILIASVVPHPFSTYAVFWVVALLLAIQLYDWVQVYMKARGRFIVITWQQIIVGVFLPIAAIPAASIFGLGGYISAQSIVITLVLILTLKASSIEIKPAIDIGEIKRLIKVGFPIMSVGILYSFFSTVDRWIIAAFLGGAELGYYSISLMVAGAATLVPMVIAQQVYPKMAESWGKTKDIRVVQKW